MASDHSDIEWTDATWNPVTGCSKVSPGCAHCYAETVAARFWPSQYPPVEYESYSVDACCPITEMRPRQFTDVMCHEDRLDQPLRWRKPRRIFVNSMSDLFHEDVPDWFIERVFSVMGLAERHTFQVLTKRPDRMLAWFRARRFDVKGAAILQTEIGECHYAMPWPLSNVWLGTSVENQRFADERIPLLLQTPAAVRFISAEPLLGPVRLLPQWMPAVGYESAFPRLDWVIVGGESGKGARNCSAQWIRSIVRQCKAAHVPVFVKQMGARVIDRNDAGFDGCEPRSWPSAIEERDGIEDHIHGFREDYQGADVRVHLLDRKGGDPSEWPEDLRIRQFPETSEQRTA